MQPIQGQVNAALQRIVGLLRGGGRAPELATAIDRHAASIERPCVVAVVGQVSSGKSTLINTLLEEDVALEGMTETTATITYFRHGSPANPLRPIVCHWRDGGQEAVGDEFIARLRGAEAGALELAARVAYLERLVPSPFLERITLVDTPGTGSVLTEHRDTLSEFLQLRQILGVRHDEETQQLGSSADAIIYLLGVTARTSDRDLVEAFQQQVQGRTRSYNTIGVLSKVDLSSNILAQRSVLADRLADSIANHVNTVVPVAAAVERARRELLSNGGAALHDLIRVLNAIPAPMREKMLAMDEFYARPDLPDCPVPFAERIAVRGAMPWATFVAVCNILIGAATLASARAELESVGGVQELRARLERHFVARSTYLRCYKIVIQVEELLKEAIFAVQAERAAIAMREQRLMAFIAAARGDVQLAAELRQLVQAQLGGAADRAKAVLDEATLLIRPLHRLLEREAEDFASLMQVGDNPELFSEQERRELRTLFDSDARSDEEGQLEAFKSRRYLAERQQAWRVSRSDGSRVRARVARQAEDNYGRLLRENLR